eukprot:TRINITY_DN7077_c0_g1_i1.p1 TRINITY_DN7077_c0_g1~~TRINITY_DN7077_c0_g1_i1.p1  ORF type:complete len:1109 (-),score=152.84 TRINITY_DN7077_c0_g1_i1:102-3401(-)
MNSDVNELEQCIIATYMGSDSNDSMKYFEVLTRFATLDYWKQNVMALRQSNNPHTLQFAAKTLCDLFTNYYGSFKEDDRREVVSAILYVIQNSGETFCETPQVREPLISLLCRLQKLTWFEDKAEGANKQVICLVKSFLEASLPLSIFAICILKQLVFEMSFETKGLTTTKHRTIAMDFREDCLKEILNISIESLRRLISASFGPQDSEVSHRRQAALISLSLDLVHQILSFDFIGTITDEASDGMSLIFAPSSWEEVFITHPMDVFFYVFEKTQVSLPMKIKCLGVVELFAAIRCSLFSTEGARKAYLNNLVNGIGRVLSLCKDSNNDEIQHKLTRILARLKTNVQLKHFMELDNYNAFMEQVIAFSVDTIKKSLSFHPVYYILTFWAKMVAALDSLSSSSDTKGTQNLVENLAPMVVTTFLETVLERVDNPLSPEEPLESEQLESIMDEIESISRCAYYKILVFIINQLGQVINQYHAMIQSGAQAEQVEKKMAWILHACASILSNKARLWSSDKTPAETVVDVQSQLICAIFECLNAHDTKITRNPGSMTKSTVYLELAFIAFLQKFSKVFISGDAFSSIKALYAMMATRLGLNEPLLVIERVLQKVTLLIEKWPTHPQILDRNLGPSGLFRSLVGGWASSKLVVKSSAAMAILQSHHRLNLGDNHRTHIAFYKALGILVFNVYRDDKTFLEFVRPWMDVFQELQMTISQSGLEAPGVSTKFIQLMYDIRGFVSPITYRLGGYDRFFEWFYSEMGYFDWLVQLLSNAENINLNLEHAWAIMDLLSEISFNNEQRIHFPITSVDGLKLFRSSSTALIGFGNLLRRHEKEIEEDDMFKSIHVYMKCLSRCLLGEYANFGVMELYNDTVLESVLLQALGFMFGSESSHLKKYPKVYSEIFTLLDKIVYQHTLFVIKCDSQLFGRCLMMLLEALHSDISAIVTQACNSIDKLVSLHISNLTVAQHQQQQVPAKTQKQIECVTSHFTTHHRILVAILAQVLNLLVSNENGQGIWSLSRPLLSLMLLFPQDYEKIVKIIIESQPDAKAEQMASAFTHLTDGIQTNITSDNREKFLTQVLKLHKQTKEFVDLNTFYKAISVFG